MIKIKAEIVYASAELETLTAQIKIKLVENKVATNIFNRTVNQNSIEIGQWLTQAKKLVGHGNFENWLADNFQMTDRTARNYMKVAEYFGVNSTFKTENVFRFQPAALIELTKLTPAELQNFLAENPTAETLSVRKLQAEIKKFKPAKSPARKSKAVKTVELQTTHQLSLFEELPRLPAQIKVEWLIPAPILDIAARAGVGIILDFSRNVKPVTSGAVVTKKFWEVESRLSQVADAVISTPPISFNRSDGKTANFKVYIWIFGGVDALPFKVFGNLFYMQKKLYGR